MELTPAEIRVANSMWASVENDDFDICSEWHLDTWQKWSEHFRLAPPLERLPFDEYVAEVNNLIAVRGKP